MPKLTDVHLLKYGNIPLPNGDLLKVDKTLVSNLAKSYDPENNHEAPAILGHDADSDTKPNDGAPAFGWLERLYSNDKGLYGDFDVTPEFAKWIRSKYYKKLSISFYPKDSPMSPVPNVPYIRHVAFLGAEAPVVKGLEPYMLAENLQLTEITMDENLIEETGMTTEIAEEWLRALLADGDKGYKDTIVRFDPVPSEDNNYLLAESDQDIVGIFYNEQDIAFKFKISKTDDGYSRVFAPENSAEAELKQNDLNGMNTEPAEMSEELMDELPSDTEPVTEPMPELEQTVADLQEVADVPADYEELESLRQELAEMRRELAEAKDRQIREEIQQFTEKLYADGKLIKNANEPTFLNEFMYKLAKQDSLTIQLSETETQSGLAWFKDFVSSVKPAIELSEIAVSKTPEPEYQAPALYGMISHDSDQTKLHAKVISLCEQKGLDYRDPLTYRNVLKEAIK